MTAPVTNADLNATVREPVRDFIHQRFPDDSIEDKTDLTGLGVLSSMFSMQLVLLLENLIGSRIPNDELNRDNFATIDAMVQLADRVRSNAAAQ